jgi:predicted ATPase
MRRDQPLRDRVQLRPEAENIAAFLLNLREAREQRYTMLRDTIRLIAPFFDDFVLKPESKGEVETVRLEWRQKGSDFPFQPSQFSDGTLRFICLATALQQPNPPATIVIDEPELGLHPYAISLLANLIEAAAEHTQVIVATQSPTLLDHFKPETVVVVKRQEGRSIFERLDAEALREWLEEYSVGELWQKNVLQGGPSHE